MGNKNMELRKIAFCIHCLGGGGAERVISVLANQFSKQGYEVHLICNIKKDKEYPLSEKIFRHYIGYDTKKNHIVSALQRIYRIRKICKDEKIQILVSFMAMAEYSVIATAGLKTKSVISIRIYPAVHYTAFLKRTYVRLLFNYADGAVFQTVEAQQWFCKKLRRKSSVIFNPVKSEFYSVKRDVVSGLIIASGRLNYQKNYPLMLNAFANVIKNHRLLLDIYGEGEDKEKLEELAKELKLDGVVRFCGHTDDMPFVLSKADCFLMTSDFEGLPNALMEAMAVGVPCICTDSLGGGAKMLIGDNERGILVPCNDKTALVNAITSLYENKDIKRCIAEEAKAYANQFSIDNCFATWEKYIIKVLNDN